MPTRPAKKIPSTTISRLSLYIRALEKLRAEGHLAISSHSLGAVAGVSAAQIRKDLAYFGQFGIPGRGYYVDNLYREIAQIMGLNRRWRVALAGVGHLGYALLGYKGFKKQGYDVVVAFDKDSALIGMELEGVKIFDIAEAAPVIAATRAEIGVLAVPAASAQEACEALIKGGLKYILCFSPEKLSVPPDVYVKRVDLTMELEWLSYFATKISQPPPPP